MSDIAQVEVVAAVQQFQADMKSAGKAFAQIMKEMGAANEPLQRAAEGTDKAHKGLLGTLREFKGEQVQQGKMARFYAGELMSIIPAADGAKSAIQGILGVAIEGMAGGLSFGLAFEAVKTGIELVTHAIEESEKRVKAAAEGWRDSINAVRAGITGDLDAIRKAIDDVSGVRPSEVRQRSADAAKETADRRARELAAMRDDVARPRAGETVNAWKKRREEMKAELAQMEEDLRAWQARARSAQEAADATRDQEAITDARELGNQLLSTQVEFANEEKKIRTKAAQEKAALELKYWKSSQQGLLQEMLRTIDANADKEIEEVRRKVALAVARITPMRESTAEVLNPAWVKEQADKAKQRMDEAQAQGLSDAKTVPTEDEGQHWTKQADRVAGEYDAKARERALDKLKQKVGETTQVAQQLGAAFGDAFSGMIAGTKSVGQAFAQMAQEMLRLILEIAVKSITASAMKAGAEAASSQAGIPIIGPALAIGAMTAMIGTVMALIGNLTSSAGGYEVPSFLSGGAALGIYHPDETILPADLSKGLKQIIRGGMAGQGGGDTHNWTVYAMDARSFEDWLSRGPGATGLLRAKGRLESTGRWK